ncbi:hypothetical protein FSP39_024031 [Pinctada imbricata]|uniref:Uncharacterized protein n=1 Tax=Pinctada imbricata TaxID=66713 RepID=A0AA89C2I0_PINIB|nr:hypothetical protein FSP39_024031 [Pinctada imbricata]
MMPSLSARRMALPRRLTSFSFFTIFLVLFLHQVDFTNCQDDELIFHCSGNKEVAVIQPGTSAPTLQVLQAFHVNNIQVDLNVYKASSLQDTCGDDASIKYNGIAVNGEISVFFSETDSLSNDSASVQVYNKNFGAGSYEGYTIWSTEVNRKDIPCGTGYLVAVVKDEGKTVDMEAVRVAHVCNISMDVNVKLEVEKEDTMTTPDYTKGMSRVHLQADGHTNIIDQLRRQGHGINKIELVNEGKNSLPRVTKDMAHVTLAYFKQSPSPTMPGGHCEVPDYSILDEIIGWDIFTDDDADLVIMYDALHTDLDNDTCDNFISIPVYVDCSYSKYILSLYQSMWIVVTRDYEEKCYVLPHHSYGGTELVMTRGDNDMFFYEVWDNKWTEEGKWEMDRNRLMGFSRFHLLSHLLKDMPPLREGRGLCAVKEDFEDESADFDPKDMPHLPTNDSLKMRFDDLKQKAEYLDLMSLSYELDQLRYEADMDYDYETRAKKYGFIMGLNASASFRHYSNMYKMHGMSVPANLTRAILGGHLYHTAMTANHAIEAGLYSPDTVIHGLGMTYGALTLLDGIESELKLEMAQRVRNALNRVAKTLSELREKSMNMTSMAMVHCKFDRKISPDVQELLFLGAGYDGKMEKHLDPSDRCHRALVFNYFRRGGARVHARDILKNLDTDPSYMKIDEKTPRMCRDHPALGHGSPPIFWEVDDRGRLMKGMYSPITDTVAWKPVATCRCDGCHYSGYYGGYHDGYYGGYNSHYYATSDSYNAYANTQGYSWTTPSWMTTSQMNHFGRR